MLYQTSRPHRLRKTSISSRNVASNIKVTYCETKEKIVNLLTNSYDEQKSISSQCIINQARFLEAFSQTYFKEKLFQKGNKTNIKVLVFQLSLYKFFFFDDEISRFLLI